MRILYAEDKEEVAECGVLVLEELGHQVVRVASVAEAFAALEMTRFDVAMLDIEMGDGLIFEATQKMDELGLPFFFASGRSRHDLPLVYAGRPYLQKPYPLDRLIAVLQARCGVARPPAD